MKRELEDIIAKRVKLYNRGIFSWQETHDCLLEDGVSPERISQEIGTEEEYLEALKAAGVNLDVKE